MKPAWRVLASAFTLCGLTLWAMAQSSVQQPTTEPPPAQQSNAQRPAAPQPTSPQAPAMLSRGDNFDLEFDAGKQAYAAAKLNDAAAHFDRAVGAATTDQDRARGLLYLGVVFAAGGRMSDAEAAFRFAMKANPACAECGFNLGFTLLKESKDNEGMAVLKAVLPQLKGTLREREVQRFIANPRRIRLDYAPEFSLKTATGDSITLDTLQGKVVLLDFWGAWCVPCRQTIPLLKKMSEEFDPAKVAIVSIDENDPIPTWKQFIAQNGMTWPQVYDADGSLRSAFRIDGFPFSVLLSKDGIILQKFKGWGPDWAGVMLAEIAKALAQN